MGYAQWVVFRIINRDPFHALVIKGVELDYGKIHENGNKDKELGVSAVEGKEIALGGEFTFSSCGRDTSPTGTEGRFTIHEKGTDKIVCHCYWDCPYALDTNEWTMSDFDPVWIVQSEGARLRGDHLGNIIIKATTGA